MKTFLFVLAFVVLILAIGLKVANNKNQSKKNAQSPVAATVTVKNSRFMPTLTSINKNQSVIFKNNDSQNYNLVSNQVNGPTVSLLSASQSKRIIFNETGSFRYQDSANADIYVTINVE